MQAVGHHLAVVTGYGQQLSQLLTQAHQWLQLAPPSLPLAPTHTQLTEVQAPAVLVVPCLPALAREVPAGAGRLGV